jgi:DNA-binding transcriptional MerR regulator
MVDLEENTSDYRTIDDFAREAGLSSRTIRFYQSRGLLQRPPRQGRVAMYGPPHLERLQLIEELQSRGLTLRGIKDLVRGQGSDNEPLTAWLDLDRMRERWTGDPPRLMSRAELEEMIQPGGARLISRLLEVGIVQLDDQDGLRRYRVNPTLLKCALEFESAGISLQVSSEVHAIVESHFILAAREVIDVLYRRPSVDESAPPENVAQAIETMFPEDGSPFVHMVFAQAVERALGEWLDTDGPKPLSKKKQAKNVSRTRRQNRRRERRK